MIKFLTTSFLLLFTVYSIAEEVTDNYELATKAFADQKMNEAFIHIKNILREQPEHLPSKILLSKIYFDAGNIVATEQELKEALMLGADINLILPLLGRSLIIQKRVSDVLSLAKYKNSFTKKSKFEWALLKGQVHILKQDDLSAQSEFEKALLLAPNNVRGINTVAYLYLTLGWLDKAKPLIEKSLRLQKNNEKTWVLQGKLSLAQGNAITALANFEQALSIDVNDPQVLRNLAFLSFRLQDMDRAEKYTQLILQQSPFDPAATLINAWLLISQDNLVQARSNLADLNDKLSNLQDNVLFEDSFISFVQGASEYLQGNHIKARQHLETYLSQFPEDISTIKMLVGINNHSELFQKTINLLEKSTIAVEKNFELSSQLIQLYLQNKRLLRAESILEQMEINFAGNPYIIYTQAKIARMRGQEEQALALLNNAEYSESKPLYILLLTGELYLQLNEITQAEIIAKKFIAEAVIDERVFNFIASLYIQQNKEDKALIFIEKILKSSPDNLTALFNKASIFSQQNKIEQSITLLNNILKQDSEHTPALLLMSRNALVLKNYESALTWATKVLVYDRLNVSALKARLFIIKQQQNWKAALTAAKKLLKSDRLNPDYLVENMKLNIKLGSFSEALKHSNILFTLWNDSAAKLTYLAKLQVSAKGIDLALKSLERAEKVDDKLITTKIAKARIYYLLDNIDKAEEIIKNIEKDMGKSTEIYLLKGDIAKEKGLLTIAQQAYTQAMTIDSTNVSAIIKLYQLTSQGVGEQEFTVLLEQLVSKKSTPVWVRKMLADSYMNQKNYQQAEVHYEYLLSLSTLEDTSSILNNLANIYAINDLNKALITANKGLAHDNKNAALLDTLGWILAQQHKYAEALAVLRKAFSLNARSAEIRYHIAYTLVKLNRKQEAKVELRASLSEGESFSEYQAAKTLLESL